MKLISWNVNGIRASLKKGFMDYFNEVDADIFCLNETKVQEGQVELELAGYYQYWSYAEKKGYSGTAIFSKHEALSVIKQIGIPELDLEGRVTAIELEDFWVVSVYAPNAQDGLARIDHRMAWEDGFRAFCIELDKDKPVIICGDLNVAHNEIDLARPKQNVGNAGFSDEERQKLNELLDAGFIDTFRYMYPDKTDAYSWWSYRANARARNVGWRIDYFLVSERFSDRIDDALLHCDIHGSDHCPVGLIIK